MERRIFREGEQMNAQRSVAVFVPALMFLLGWGVVLGVDIFSPPELSLTPDVQLALTNEQEVAEMLPGRRWSDNAIAEAASRIAFLPDQAACELLWRFASAPSDFNTTPVFDNALASASPRVRAVAEAILLAKGDGSVSSVTPEE